MDIVYSLLYQFSAAFFYSSIVILLVAKQFSAHALIYINNRYLFLYSLYWIVLFLAEWPNNIHQDSDLWMVTEFFIRHIHLFMVIPLFFNVVATRTSYTIILMVFINPWRESIQNWLVYNLYQFAGDDSIITVQTSLFRLFGHWNIALMILICIQLFFVFHIYRRADNS